MLWWDRIKEITHSPDISGAITWTQTEVDVKEIAHSCNRCKLKNDGMILVPFQGKPVNITVIQVYDPTSNAKDA